MLGVNNSLPLLYMSKKFVYLHNTEERINEFLIGYIVNPTLHVTKAFKEQVEKFTNDAFGTITQPFIKNPNKKNYVYN